MRVVLSDWDGVWFSSEVAKALRWYLVAMHLKGDNEVSKDLLDRILQEDQETKQWLENFIKDKRRAEEIKKTMEFAGGPRIKFDTRVYHEFINSSASEEEVSRVMLPLGEKIKDVLIKWFSKPFFENVRFFKELAYKFQSAYWNEQPIGLVTQTKSEALYQQLFELKDSQGKSIWGEFEEFLQKSFSPYLRERGFLKIECAGNYEEKFPGAMFYLRGKEKVMAYLILCQKMGVRSEEKITFEDTKMVLKLQKRQGLLVLELKL